MSIFDMFTSKPAPAQTAPVAGSTGQPGNIPDPASLQDGVAPSATTPAAGSATPTGADNPLAPFAELWKNEPKSPTDSTPEPDFNLTQEAVQSIVSKTDFSKVVSPEHMAAIAAGGEGAQAAFAMALNQVAQHTMVQSTLVNNKLSQKQIEAAITKQLAKLPNTLRQQAATDHLNSNNPLFSNPAVKPVIEATHAQLLQKFPNATNAEITKMTHDYVLALGNSFAPQVAAPTAPGDTDWSNFESQLGQ